jgi:hypothetical protein
MPGPANIINHIGFVLDASSSMHYHEARLVEAADSQIRYLAHRSQELEQETRISVWTFSGRGTVQCVVWDKDVLRLPSIGSLYSPNGMTALVDASLRSISDLAETPERYGDHSFLVYVWTDGQENDSRYHGADLATRVQGLPDNWTLAALVPDTNGIHEAKRFGFPAGNVERWDTRSADGATEAGTRIREVTDAYMRGRATGVRSTRTLFSTGADAVNSQTVRQAGLVALRPDTYRLVPVHQDSSIRDFTEREVGRPYVIGRGYYQLSKAEMIQPQKELAVVDRPGVGGTRSVYVGREARQLVGLPDMHTRVTPTWNPDYDIFVQSTSTNRRLKAGTDYLYLL